MDKLEKYKTIIKKELEYELAKNDTLRRRLVINENQTDFLLLNFGHQGKKYYHYVLFHVAIEKGQVIVYQDNTDIGLPKILVEAGIDKSDLVLGFWTKFSQKLSPYAVAA